RDRGFREETVSVVDPYALLFDRDRNDQRPYRLGTGILLGGNGFLADAAARPLAALRHGLNRPVESGIIVLPVVNGGVRLRGGGDDSYRRKSRNLPNPLGRNFRHRYPMPALVHY